MARQAGLTARDWVLAGARVLAREGIAGVRIERLARDLKATKGSFYWHFAGLPALHEALLAFWETEGTEGIIAGVETLPTPEARLLAVLARALEASVHAIDSPAFEVGLRGWARIDPTVAARLGAIETRRVDFLVTQLRAIGWPEVQALAHGRALYMGFAGYQALAAHAPALADGAALTALARSLCTPPAA